MNKIKELLAWFKHIVKDPIKTIAEADARKKEIMPLLYVSIGVTAVFTILDAILSTGFLMIFGLIGLMGVGFCALLLFVISKAKTKFAALTCDDCKTMLDIDTKEDFAKYVSYDILSDTTKFNLTHPSSNNGVVSSVRATGEGNAVLLVTFTCPNCGKSKTFKYSIAPFKCQREQKNVRIPDLELVKSRLEDSVRNVLAIYASENRSKIPYTIQSIHHPDYENREKLQMGSGPDYEGVTIRYHREIDEMVEGLFIRNELNGSITLSK